LELLMQRALKLNAAFAHWPGTALDRIQRGACLRTYVKGEVVPSNDRDPRYGSMLVIVSGYLRLQRVINGKRACTVGILGPGRVWRSRCNDARSTQLRYEQVAQEPTVLIHVASEALSGVLAQFPVLWRDLGAVMLKQQRELIETIVEQTRGTAVERLASLLLRFQDQYGSDTVGTGAGALRVRLSQEDLGALAQLCRQTANEALGRLQELGVIQVDYSSVSVKDPAALRCAAGRSDVVSAPPVPARSGGFGVRSGFAPVAGKPLPNDAAPRAADTVRQGG